MCSAHAVLNPGPLPCQGALEGTLTLTRSPSFPHPLVVFVSFKGRRVPYWGGVGFNMPHRITMDRPKSQNRQNSSSVLNCEEND